MISNSLWIIQRALPVILLSAIPHLTECNILDYEVQRIGYPDVSRVRRAPFNSWAGKRADSMGERDEDSYTDLGQLEG